MCECENKQTICEPCVRANDEHQKKVNTLRLKLYKHLFCKGHRKTTHLLRNEHVELILKLTNKGEVDNVQKIVLETEADPYLIENYRIVTK